MSRRIGTTLVIAALAVTAWLYGRRLDYAPPNLEIDEALIGIDAHAVATTGRDLRGERLPLYSQTAEHSWYQPMVIYATAAVLEVAPLSERTVRIPAVCFGVINVALMYLAARRLFASEAAGVGAALLLMLTPAHFLHSRYAMDYMYPATFVLAWCWCLAEYADRRTTSSAVAAAAVLGIGFYSYISAIVLIPIYFVMTIGWLLWHRAPGRTIGAAAAVFAVLLVPFAAWALRHPSAFGATAEKYGVLGGQSAGLGHGLRQIFGFVSVSDRLSMYWNMLGPAPLFLDGGSRVMFATGRAGVFLVPLALFIIAGLLHALVYRPSAAGLLMTAGFLTAPLPALAVTDENAPLFRALTIVPFGVLLAVLGVRAVMSMHWTSRGAAALRTAAVIALLAAVPLQFAVFSRDYFNGYRVRVSPWLGGNIGGALERLIVLAAKDDSPAVYFSTLQSTSGIPDGRNMYMDAYWRFYLTKHRADGLLARTHQLDPATAGSMAAGSLVLANVGDRVTGALVSRGILRQVATVPELDRAPFFAILER